MIETINPTMETPAGRAWFLIESLSADKRVGAFERRVLREAIWPALVEKAPTPDHFSLGVSIRISFGEALRDLIERYTNENGYPVSRIIDDTALTAASCEGKREPVET